MELKNGSNQLLSKIATTDDHGENSPYFDGWKAYENDPFHPTKNPNGVIQMGLAENQLTFGLVKEWVKNNPSSSICSSEGVHAFKDVSIFQDYHGLPEFRNAVAKFMEKGRGDKVSFDRERIVMGGGATGANEMMIFCLADPGDAFLIPTPYYPGFDRDLRWRTRVQLLPVVCERLNKFQITEKALEEAYENAQKANIKVKGLIITNPSNPLGTMMGKTTLTTLVNFINDKQIHLVCDEIYAATVRSDDFISISEIIQDMTYCNRDLIHIVYSLSKDMGFPGFRVGIVYSYNDVVVKICRKMSSFGLVSSQTQHLLASMLSDEEFVAKFLSESKKMLATRHEKFTNGLKKVGISCLESEAGLFCWMNLRPLLKDNPTFEDEMEIWREIINEVKVNISPGSSFHCHEPGWFRVCFANMDVATMEVALRRIEKFFGKEEEEEEVMLKNNKMDLRLSLSSIMYDESMMMMSPHSPHPQSPMVRARN